MQTLFDKPESKKQVLVYGSNYQGINGAGAAAIAVRNWNAPARLNLGLGGQAYALPTKISPSRTLGLEYIQGNIYEFLQVADRRDDLEFLLTRIGCGLAGYSESDIQPLFFGVPSNVKDTWTEHPVSSIKVHFFDLRTGATIRLIQDFHPDAFHQIFRAAKIQESAAGFHRHLCLRFGLTNKGTEHYGFKAYSASRQEVRVAPKWLRGICEIREPKKG